MISILIPFKNTAHFLEECLDSILTQTYEHWEVMAVDDHSSDSSYKLLQTYAQRDHRIQVFKNEGEGIIPALRLAYAKSKGNFITRMDSDDIMKPNRLDHMVASLKNYGKGHLAVGQVKYFSDEGISDGYARYEKWLNTLTAKGTSYTEIYKECVIPSPCWMVYREDFEASGAFNPPDSYRDGYPEDYDLTFRFYRNGLKVIPCDEILHLWRDYDSRTSRTHEHYAQNYFLDIKLHYFLKLDYDQSRPLVVWGAGFKGKSIAKKLIDQKIAFTWLCDNPKKINKKIYGQAMHHYSEIERLHEPQSLVTVANEVAQKEIKQYLASLGQSPMADYFFFC